MFCTKGFSTYLHPNRTQKEHISTDAEEDSVTQSANKLCLALRSNYVHSVKKGTVFSQRAVAARPDE